MVEPITAAVAAAATDRTVKAVQTAFAATVSKNVGRVAKSVSDRAIVALQIGFNEYLFTSYNKCRLFKSILCPQEPLVLLDHYVNVNLTCGTNVIQDQFLVDDIQRYRNVVVTGLAGSGKSMLMKYLTISHFENPRGVVPLFVELRQLNSLTNQDLLTFIRSSCTSKSHNVTSDQFALSLRAGGLMLILDGFDELQYEIRDNIQRQILDFGKDFPNTTVVISSRPDDRFHSWPSFYVFKVNELSEDQVQALIGNLQYDTGVKKRFLKEVKSTLYKSHKSFLSSPLLASIMLLTYEEFAEIPQKMHAFYGQAFDTLFQKHDAQKEQYQRRTRTQLTREAFKDCFAVFCAMSYLEEHYSFSEEQLNTTARNSIKYLVETGENFPHTVTEDQLVSDLFESVCMLQKDGLEVTFVHRSFQEYFTSLFVRGLPADKIKPFLDKCADRFTDAVVPMAIDLSRNLVENNWVIPAIIQLEQQLDFGNKDCNLLEKLRLIFPQLIVRIDNGQMIPTAFGLEDSLLGTIETLARAYPSHLPRNIAFRGISHLSRESILNGLDKDDLRANQNYGKILRAFSSNDYTIRFYPNRLGRQSNMNERKTLFVVSEEENDWWLKVLGVGDMFSVLRKSFSAIRDEIASRDSRRDNILRDFF